jgi:hypothetical protein
MTFKTLESACRAQRRPRQTHGQMAGEPFVRTGSDSNPAAHEHRMAALKIVQQEFF